MYERLRPYRWVVLAIVLALVAGVVAYRSLTSDDPRVGSELVGDGRVEFADEELDAYRIVYRVSTKIAEGFATETQDVLVRRPFEAGVSIRSESGGEPRVSRNAFGLYDIAGQSFFVQPGAPEPDRHPLSLVDEAVRDGYADLREVRRVAGRLCRVVRVGETTQATSIPRLDDLGPDVSDVCVDARGLVLEEVTYTKGAISKRSVATRVDTDPEVDRDALDVKQPKGDPKQVGSVKQVTDDSPAPGDQFWELPDRPKGFKLRGRYSVVPPGQPGFQDPTAQGSILAFMSEVWTDGPAVIVVDQGAIRSGAPFEDDPNAKAVRAGALGKGELRYAFRESEVRFRTKGSAFVRVRGTVEPSRLLAIARSLEVKPGGELQPLD